MRALAHIMALSWIARMSRRHDIADAIRTEYEWTYGRIGTWPAVIAYRCANAIKEAVA